MEQKPTIGVVGGGFAGLEALFCLRYLLKEQVHLTLINDKDHFIFKPNTIYIPFGAAPEKFIIDLVRPMQLKDIDFDVAEARAIDPATRTVTTATGSKSFDYLIIATGASMRPEEIPGLKEHALTPWTSDEMLRLREGLERVKAHALAGQREKLLFLVPPNNKCSGPLYELVLMTDTWLRRAGVRDTVELIWTTYEQSFIQAFGPRLHTVVTKEFDERHIEAHTGFVVTAVEAKRVLYQNGEVRDFDLLVSFPPYVAKERFAGLPTDDRGFITVDPDSRRVKGFNRIFAIGDASNFPIKQAFLALLQGDTAAEQISAEIEGRDLRQPGRFEPISMCVMEELNKATFAQVPLKYTEDPLRPIEVDTDDLDHYKVGVSPLWRGGKKLLGIYLPWRFGNGEPFHAGFAWNAMDLGLKVMSHVLAK